MCLFTVVTFMGLAHNEFRKFHQQHFTAYCNKRVCWCSIFGVLWQRYGLYNRRNILRFLAGTRDFSLLRNVQTDPRTKTVSYLMLQGFFPGSEAAGAWCCPFVFITVVRNAWSCICTLPYTFMLWTMTNLFYWSMIHLAPDPIIRTFVLSCPIYNCSLYEFSKPTPNNYMG